MMVPITASVASATTASSSRCTFGGLQRCSRSTRTIAPWRKAAGMARNTIQIRLKRISTSVHSAGCSSTKRMTIWNMPSAAAKASIAQAPSIALKVLQRSKARKAFFIGRSVGCGAKGSDGMEMPARPPALRAFAAPGQRSSHWALRICSSAALPNCFSNCAFTGARAATKRALSMLSITVMPLARRSATPLASSSATRARLGVAPCRAAAGGGGVGGLGGGVDEGVVVWRRELVEQGLVHQEQGRRVDMTGEREVLLHLVEFGGDDHRQRVFLTVDRALLQRSEHLGERHRRGEDAKALVRGDMHGVFHRAHLQALEVAGFLDRALAVAHVAKAVLGPGQGLEPFAVEPGQHLLADGAVEHGARMGLVAKQEGDIQDLGLGHEIGYRAGGTERQFMRAQLHRFDRFAFGAQRRVVEGLHLVAAAGALFHFLGKGVDGHALVG